MLDDHLPRNAYRGRFALGESGTQQEGVTSDPQRGSPTHGGNIETISPVVPRARRCVGRRAYSGGLVRSYPIRNGIWFGNSRRTIRIVSLVRPQVGRPLPPGGPAPGLSPVVRPPDVRRERRGCPDIIGAVYRGVGHGARRRPDGGEGAGRRENRS